MIMTSLRGMPRSDGPCPRAGRRVALPLFLLALLSAAFTLLTPVAGAQRCAAREACELCVDVDYPTQGQSCRIHVRQGGEPLAGAPITATSRPNSKVESTIVLGRTDADGRFAWTPEEAGITTLAVRQGDEELASLTISVRFKGIPILGLLVMLGAAGILFGGNSYSFAKTFGKS
jgi:hypothetical protein